MTNDTMSCLTLTLNSLSDPFWLFFLGAARADHLFFFHFNACLLFCLAREYNVAFTMKMNHLSVNAHTNIPLHRLDTWLLTGTVTKLTRAFVTPQPHTLHTQ